jgi:hypothetical protein
LEYTAVAEASTQGVADTNALAAANAWRAQRYGSDSAGVNLSPQQDPAASPTTQGVVPSHHTLTKDKN